MRLDDEFACAEGRPAPSEPQRGGTPAQGQDQQLDSQTWQDHAQRFDAKRHRQDQPGNVADGRV